MVPNPHDPDPSPRRRAILLVAAAVLAAVLGVVGAAWAMGNDDPPPPTEPPDFPSLELLETTEPALEMDPASFDTSLPAADAVDAADDRTVGTAALVAADAEITDFSMAVLQLIATYGLEGFPAFLETGQHRHGDLNDAVQATFGVAAFEVTEEAMAISAIVLPKNPARGNAHKAFLDRDGSQK